MGKTRLIQRLIDKAMMESMRGCHNSDGSKRRPLQERDLPGRLIMSLSDDERKILESCNADDFKWRGWK